MADHARLSPSGAHRWIPCPPSIGMEEAVGVRPSSVYADEGTKAHDVAARTLTGKSYSDLAPDDEMLEHVGNYVDFIKTSVRPTDTVFIEQRVECSAPELFGTADCVIIGPNDLHLVDLKYGQGVRVDAENNEQLMLYALACIDTFMLEPHSVRMTIVQPRLDHISSAIVGISELREFRRKAQAAADIIAAGTGEYNPGEKQCRFCAGKANCPALAEKVYEDVVGMMEDLDELEASTKLRTDDQIAGNFADVPLIEMWCEAIRAEAFKRAQAGAEQFKLIAGKKGARKWSNNEAALTMMEALGLSEADIYDRSMISPTTAEKLVKSKKISKDDWSMLQTAITQAEGKLSVVLASDPRPAADVSADFVNLDASEQGTTE